MLNITIFTDPMMGLSYESTPFLAKLENYYSTQIRFTTKMAGLVRDVSDFMISDDFSDGEKQVLVRYNRRLAKIYQTEQNISGLPICITPDNLALFDETHRSSTPMNLAVKAVQHIAPEKAEIFLYRLRYALIVETRPITHWDEILRTVNLVGLNAAAFQTAFADGTAETELDKDWTERDKLGIRSLPAYLLDYHGRQILVQGVADDGYLMAAVEKLTEGKIQPQAPQQSMRNLQNFLTKHPLVSLIELQYAFGFSNVKDVMTWITPQLNNTSLTMTGNGNFVQVSDNLNTHAV